MRLFFIVLMCIICTMPVQAKHLHKESEYQNKWCTIHNGITEYKLKDSTRIDCLTDNWAVEFDFANKWAECIGQSLHYGRSTGKTPVCVLIMENPVKDIYYLKRLRGVAYKHGIKTFTLKSKYLE